VLRSVVAHPLGQGAEAQGRDVVAPTTISKAPSGPTGGRMTSQGSVQARFTRAIKARNLFMAEVALREMRAPSLLEALDYLELLAVTKPEKLEAAAIRWHGRLELEAKVMTLEESQLALAALASLCAGDREAIEILRRLMGRVSPTLVRRIR